MPAFNEVTAWLNHMPKHPNELVERGFARLAQPYVLLRLDLAQQKARVAAVQQVVQHGQHVSHAAARARCWSSSDGTISQLNPFHRNSMAPRRYSRTNTRSAASGSRLRRQWLRTQCRNAARRAFPGGISRRRNASRTP